VKRRTVVTAIVIGGPLSALVILALYLRFADLSGWRDMVAEKISQSLGREVRIAGVFEPEIGLTTRLSAGDVTLANPSWSNDPTMVSIRHLSVELKLLSLISGPLTIHDIEIEDADVLLEKNADGQANWVFGTGGSSKPSTGPVEMVLQHVLLEDVRLTWREPSRAEPLEAGFAHFETTEDHTGMLQIECYGTVDRHDVRIAGNAGSLVGLINAAALEFDLTGSLDDIQFSSKGDIKDLKTLAGVDVTADVHGADLGNLSGLLDLPPELTGPFDVSAAVSPTTAGSDIHIEAAAAGITARVDGAIDSLVKPKVLDATVTASGPSIRTVGSLTGVTDLPEEGFSVTGGIRWEGFPITFRQVEITVGDNALSVDGVLGVPPAMMGTDLTVKGQGPDVSTIGALAGIDLPRDRFSIEGRVVRIDDALEIENIDARIGQLVVTANGRVGDPPDYTGTTLEIHAQGPNIAHFNRLIGAKLPARPFTIDGRFAQGDEAITLDRVSARVGGIDLRVDGSLKTAKGLTGTSLQIDAQGPDASLLRALVGLDDLPAEAWSAVGGLDIVDSGLHLTEVSASVGSLHARADGRMGTARGLVGTDLQLHAEDPDLAHAMPIFGVQGFPKVPIRAEGRLRVEDSGIRLDGATGTAGDVEVTVDGLIGKPHLDGTNGHVSVRGPRLSSLGVYFRQPDFPAAPFSVEGNLHIDKGAYNLGGVAVMLDGNHATIDGTMHPDRGLIGTDVQIEMTAPDLEKAGRVAATLTKVPVLPAEPLALTTHLHIDEAGYEIDDFHATLDKATATVNGRVGTSDGLVGTNLTVDIDGPNASLFSALTGAKIPEAPFTVRGRIERTEDLFIFDHFAIRLGGHTVDLHGSVGEKPHLIGTDLDLHASGPGTGLIEDLTGFDKLPDKPFSVGGAFFGTPEKFTADNFEVTLGASDLKGSIEVDIRSKPQVTAKLSSNRLDLGELRSRHSGQDNQKPAPQSARPGSKTAMVFSSKPIDFGWLRRADADVDVTVGTLQMPAERFQTVELTARLVDGRLDVDRLSMVGSRGGSGSGSMVMEPAGDGYRASLSWDLKDVRFALPGEDAPDSAAEPSLDIEVRLQAQGTSPHEFAASSDGSIQVIVGRGVMDNRVLDLISADILLTLLHAFNPFAKENVATELECAVVLVNFDQGVATLQPMALQSNKMTMLGSGRIDLGTEKLNLDWVTKPRKGIGISASMITNPYIKLGGTLSHPVIELKPMQAIASTGAAVATLGITWVAKGMLDRASADKKVCKQALEQIAKADAASSAPHAQSPVR